MSVQPGYKIHHFGEGLLETDTLGYFFLVRAGEVARNNDLGLWKGMADLMDEFIKIEMGTHGGQVGIDIVGGFDFGHKGNILDGNVGAQIENLNTPVAEDEVHEQQSQFMIFPLG